MCMLECGHFIGQFKRDYKREKKASLLARLNDIRSKAHDFLSKAIVHFQKTGL
jgi:hypothetical protein